MKTIEIKGFKRANLGKVDSKNLREEANVPCVIYGGDEQVHFYASMFSFRDFVYTPNTYKISIDLEGKKYDSILQDIQYHPVNDMILHADFLQLTPGKELKINIPVKFVGVSPGVIKGGKMVQKINKLSVKTTPENLPDFIEVDISNLDLNKSVKVSEVKLDNVTILTNQSNPIASVTVPRGLKDAAADAPADGKAKAPEKKK